MHMRSAGEDSVRAQPDADDDRRHAGEGLQPGEWQRGVGGEGEEDPRLRLRPLPRSRQRADGEERHERLVICTSKMFRCCYMSVPSTFSYSLRNVLYYWFMFLPNRPDS